MKKKFLIGGFVVGLFSIVAVTMVVTGKINIPVISKQSDVSSSFEDIQSTNETGANYAQSSDNITSSNAYTTTGDTAAGDQATYVEDADAYGSEIYSVATTSVPISSYTSISDVAVDEGGNIYAADATGCKLYKLDSSGSVLQTYSTSVPVNGLFVNSDYVYALEGELAGNVTVLDKNLSKITSVEVGHTPVDMVVNETTGYVANRYSNTVSVIDLNANKVVKTIDVTGREPQALCLANGKIYVACHLPEEGSTETVMSANVVVINTADNSVVGALDLINGAGGVKGICASPDGDTVYVSHIIARYTYPTTQLDRGWINTNGISIIDASADTVTTSIMLDEVELGAANPWGITVSEDGKQLICALSGTDEVMVVDIAAMNAKIDAVKAGSGVVSSMEDIPNYLPFLDGCRERITLSGKGARAVWAVSDQVYVGLYFDGSIDVVDLSNKTVNNLSFITQPEADAVRKGEIIFSDATLCYQKWQSCLSCHPDARVDGLNWDNMNDGIGNPKSAKSMMYSHRTPPTMSTGIRASAEIAVRAGMKYIQFNSLEEEQMAYMDEYLKSLQPVQSPYLNRDGTLTESAQRGKEIFTEVGCATCHPAPLYTDLKTHEADTTNDTFGWENRAMDTPSLVEVWRTGPWTFDGRFGSMKDAVARYAQSESLSEQELTDLTNYVLSIGNEGELYGVEQVVVSSGGSANINKLIPGGTIDYLTVRRQQYDAVDSANVTLIITNGGNEVLNITEQIADTAFNTAVKVTFDSKVTIPHNLKSGATLAISITDADGNKLASDYVMVY